MRQLAEPQLLQGNEACAQAALAAGCRFYAVENLSAAPVLDPLLARR